jgi:hypothetical protein
MNQNNSRQDCNLEEFINQANLPSNKLHPRSTTTIVQTQRSRESLPTSRSISFLIKEWWCLGEDILRAHDKFTVSLQRKRLGMMKTMRVSTTNKVLLDSQHSVSCKSRIQWMRCEIDLKEITTWKRPLKAINSNAAITGTFTIAMGTFKVASDTYTLIQGYKHTCELMLMWWCIWYGAM